MGNNPSKPAGRARAPSSAGTPSHSPANNSRESRRGDSTPINKATPATTQESITSATAQPTSQPSSNKPHLHQHLHFSELSSTQRRTQEEAMGNEQSRQKWKEKSEASKKEKDQSVPVKVPRGGEAKRQRGPDSQFEPSGPPRDPNYIPHSNLNFPPRLPLPIEEEIHTPGSPIITSADLSSALQEDEIDGAIPHRSSLLSSTTADEDDIGDELQQYPRDDGSRRRTVPTLVQWKQGGEKIYVTGTFTSWSRKFRMIRDPGTNVLSATLELPPGTHHVKFIVDGDMQLSNELPTAVDYTNILVNYIEVSADDLPNEPSAEQKVPNGVYPPQSLPSGTETADHAPDSVGKTQPSEDGQVAPPIWWAEDVPNYLFDLDHAEQSRRYQRAARGVADIPTPPSLPLFLGKSILNGTTPMKDDSSVLNMPNHTVLNHLATSSIKNGVLATSVTTRYKRKYVTTIVYKPTNEEGD